MKLVSAILPTRGRREWALQALHGFLLQDYPHKEIVIVDDFEEPSFPTLEGMPPRSLTVSAERRIGAKRNLACEHARGEIIVHFDSDDWSDPHRITDQMERLEASGKMCTGYHSMLFYDVTAQRCAKFEGYGADAIGTSLCYYKKYWEEHRFRDELRIYEDNAFSMMARNVNQLFSVDAGGMMVARIHPDNTDPKSLDKPMFTRKPLEALPAGFPR